MSRNVDVDKIGKPKNSINLSGIFIFFSRRLKMKLFFKIIKKMMGIVITTNKNCTLDKASMYKKKYRETQRIERKLTIRIFKNDSKEDLKYKRDGINPKDAKTRYLELSLPEKMQNKINIINKMLLDIKIDL